MLIAVLNTCSKEELDVGEEEEVGTPTLSEESQERRKVIRNKILAVGRISRVFSLLRCVLLAACAGASPADSTTDIARSPSACPS
jgi:hypothetical protein